VAIGVGLGRQPVAELCRHERAPRRAGGRRFHHDLAADGLGSVGGGAAALLVGPLELAHLGVARGLHERAQWTKQVESMRSSWCAVSSPPARTLTGGTSWEGEDR